MKSRLSGKVTFRTEKKMPSLNAHVEQRLRTDQIVWLTTAFPDLHLTIEDEIAEGDKVVTRVTARGTHQGSFMGIRPTGKRAVVTGIVIDRFANGKTVEAWNNLDDLGLLQQLGVIPAPG